MQKLLNWPMALLKKWVAAVVTGIGCLMLGAEASFAMHDRMMLAISVILSICVIARCAWLYLLIGNGKYKVAEGICTSVEKAPLRRQWSLFLADRDMTPESGQAFYMSQAPRLMPGDCCKIYYIQEEYGCHTVLSIERLAWETKRTDCADGENTVQ